MPARIPTDDLVADLQATAADRGEPLTMSKYNKYGSYSAKAVGRRFDGWNNGLRKAGLEVGTIGEAEPVDVLLDLRRVADDGLSVSSREYQSVGTLSKDAQRAYFDRWWKASVSAGLSPLKRRPLTPEQFDRYYRAVRTRSSKHTLPVLLFMFSGMSVQTALELSPDWLRRNRDRNILRVPAEVAGGEPWLVRLPETWYNPHTGERTPTTLPETLEWVLSNYGGTPHESIKSLRRKCCEVAADANLPSRERQSRYELGKVPLVRPEDLSYTHGVNLVRQGVDTDVVERRLGTDRYRAKFNVDDVMLWVYVHDGYEHPEFDPPPVVLDPDTGEPRRSDSEPSESV